MRQGFVEPLLQLTEGTEIGVSDWLIVEQWMVDRFAELTRDPDPLHIDPEWAARNGPFGGPVAFGFLTLSLLTHLFRSAVKPDLGNARRGLFLNYGFDRVRLVAPVAVGTRIRGRFLMGGTRPAREGRLIVTFRSTVEREGEAKPALCCDWLSAWEPPRGG